ncbi:condensation domain-containing protein [Streptomyces sp. NPDC059454]|uniref:condensation domain-containing protein n=1 Tax=Streptomyces sp. NPDC059454 TaxID=3346836 RepID=UPI00368D693F
MRIWCEQELGRPLGLEGGPLFRAAVVTEGPEAVHLVLTSHHIVTDAWALNALTLRILSDYRSRLSGKTFRPPVKKQPSRQDGPNPPHTGIPSGKATPPSGTRTARMTARSTENI